MLKVLLVTFAFGTVQCGNWYEDLIKSGRDVYVECRTKTGAFRSSNEDVTISVVRMTNCVKKAFIASLEELVQNPKIQINDYVSMKIENSKNYETNFSTSAETDDDDDFTNVVSKRVFRLFDTHSFKINLFGKEGKEDVGQFEGRRRHHYRKAFPMMVAGFMVMSAFLVPLGFQFMAMIGGKALLLAKMAFFMSMFSGYKRLTNDLDYHHHHHPSGNDLLHHLAFHHRSSENPMTLAYAHHNNNIIPIYRKG